VLGPIARAPAESEQGAGAAVRDGRKLGTINIMQKNPLNKGVLTENGSGIGTVTRDMVEARASELAAIAGRIPLEPSEADYEQAKRELTGDPEMDVQETALESKPESERWDPVPGSMGCHTPESFSEDEDSEGRRECATRRAGDQRSGALSNAPGSPSSPEERPRGTVSPIDVLVDHSS
jgi:hypothetical protein